MADGIDTKQLNEIAGEYGFDGELLDSFRSAAILAIQIYHDEANFNDLLDRQGRLAKRIEPLKKTSERLRGLWSGLSDDDLRDLYFWLHGPGGGPDEVGHRIQWLSEFFEELFIHPYRPEGRPKRGLKTDAVARLEEVRSPGDIEALEQAVAIIRDFVVAQTNKKFTGGFTQEFDYEDDWDQSRWAPRSGSHAEMIDKILLAGGINIIQRQLKTAIRNVLRESRN